MALTSIADQKTPGRPIEITFAAELGLPSANQEVLLIGKKDAVSGSAAVYTVVSITNVSDATLAATEAAAKFGAGSELAKMVVAAVKANAGGSTFPALKAVPLASGDTNFGSTDQALVAAKAVKAEFIVSPFDASSDAANRTKLISACAEMSGAQRVHNNQFGTIGVAVNRSVTDASNLPSPDSQFFCPIWLRDTGTSGNAPAYSIAEVAAAAAARIAANAAPFNPMDNVTIANLDAPKVQSDWILVGGGLESETALNKGWTPLRVKPNGEVAFIRTRTSRITSDGTTFVTGYYDVQDFQVLYFWRKTIYTRLTQPDLVQVKASVDTAQLIKSELIRLATLFQDQTMFQNVLNLAKKFKVERSVSDRHRFDVFTPVNVIPGLHVVAVNVQATTEGDELSI